MLTLIFILLYFSWESRVVIYFSVLIHCVWYRQLTVLHSLTLFLVNPELLSLYIFELTLPLFVLLFQARSLLYQFRLLPRIPCSLHDLCKLCGPGMWDSRYIPTVECSGEHPDSQSCPYGGTSTPRPSSPFPASTPSPSPNSTPTHPSEGKKGCKTRDIFTFRKQSWGGGYGELCWSWLMLVQQRFGSVCQIPELFCCPLSPLSTAPAF